MPDWSKCHAFIPAAMPGNPDRFGFFDQYLASGGQSAIDEFQMIRRGTNCRDLFLTLPFGIPGIVENGQPQFTLDMVQKLRAAGGAYLALIHGWASRFVRLTSAGYGLTVHLGGFHHNQWDYYTRIQTDTWFDLVTECFRPCINAGIPSNLVRISIDALSVCSADSAPYAYAAAMRNKLGPEEVITEGLYGSEQPQFQGWPVNADNDQYLASPSIRPSGTVYRVVKCPPNVDAPKAAVVAAKVDQIQADGAIAVVENLGGIASLAAQPPAST